MRLEGTGHSAQLKGVVWGVKRAPFIRKSDVCIARYSGGTIVRAISHHKFRVIRCMGVEPQALATRSTLPSSLNLRHYRRKNNYSTVFIAPAARPAFACR